MDCGIVRMVCGLHVGVPLVGVFGIWVVGFRQGLLFVVVARCVCSVMVHWLVWKWVLCAV